MKRMLFFVLLLSGLFFTGAEISAQWRDSIRTENKFFQSIRANHIESYVTFGQGFGNLESLIFEGLISPYFLIRTNKDARWGATISPAILIRMEAKESFPVQAPSYMPNFTFYHHLAESKAENQYLFLTLKHHSNGQYNNFFNDDGTVNTRTGDFSTNLLEVGLFFNKSVLAVPNTSEYFRSSVEYHLDIGRSKELEGRYSFLRWHNSFRIFRFLSTKTSGKEVGNLYSPTVQTRLETTWMFGDINNAAFFNLEERLNFSLWMSYRPRVLNDVGLFANLYTGKDYYNMQFDRRIWVLRIGLMAYSIK